MGFLGAVFFAAVFLGVGFFGAGFAGKGSPASRTFGFVFLVAAFQPVSQFRQAVLALVLLVSHFVQRQSAGGGAGLGFDGREGAGFDGGGPGVAARRASPQSVQDFAAGSLYSSQSAQRQFAVEATPCFLSLPWLSRSERPGPSAGLVGAGQHLTEQFLRRRARVGDEPAVTAGNPLKTGVVRLRV